MAARAEDLPEEPSLAEKNLDTAVIVFGILEDVLTDVVRTAAAAAASSTSASKKRKAASKATTADDVDSKKKKKENDPLSILSDIPDFVLSDIPANGTAEKDKSGKHKQAPADPDAPDIIKYVCRVSLLKGAKCTSPILNGWPKM